MSLADRILFRDVVFAMDWEDPTTQQRALDVRHGDHVLAITAGGCNVLDLALAEPGRLISIDGNAAQTHLLELKIAGAKALDHATFFDIFAARDPGRVRDAYPRMRAQLSAAAQQFWDRNLRVVEGNLYRSGRIGLYLRILRALLRVFSLPPSTIAELVDAPDLAAQRAWFDTHLRGKLEHPIARRFLRSKLLNTLSGMHPAQLAKVEAEGGFDTQTLARLERVLTALPVRENYFVAMAATGGFRGDRVPRYLRRENFDQLRDVVGCIEPVTGMLDDVIDALPAESLHKIYLLDIFDWMTPPQIEASMRRIARVAAPGAIAMYRAVPLRLDPPPSVLAHWAWDRDFSAELLNAERSLIHGSLYVLRNEVN